MRFPFRNLPTFLLAVLTAWAFVACCPAATPTPTTPAKHACCATDPDTAPDQSSHHSNKPLHDNSCFRCITFGFEAHQPSPNLAPIDHTPFLATLPPALALFPPSLAATPPFTPDPSDLPRQTLLDLSCALNL